MIPLPVRTLVAIGLLGSSAAPMVVAQVRGVVGSEELTAQDQQEQGKKREDKKKGRALDEGEDEGGEFQIRARDLRSFDEILQALLQPTELGSTRLGKIQPYPVASLTLPGFMEDRLRIFPYLETELVWDDNVLLADSDEGMEPGSFIWETALGGMGLYEFADGNGRLDFGWISTVSEFQHNASDFWEHVGDLNFKYDVKKFGIAAGYKWEQRVSALRTDITGNRERDISTLYAKGTLRPDEKLTLEVGWSWQDTQFEQAMDNILDMTAMDVYASGGYEIDEGQRLLVEFGHNRLNFFEGAAVPGSLNDGHGNRILGGIEMTKATPEQKEWSLLATVGLQWVNYEDDHGVGDSNDQESQLIANLTGEKWVSEDTKLQASYRRMFAPSSFSNFLAIDRLDAGVETALNSAWRFKAGTYLEYARPSLRGPGGRPLTRFGIGIGTRYYFEKWASLGFDYEYRQRIWTRPGVGAPSDYANNRLALSLSVHF